MQRARRNVETLYQRLQSIGYQFQCERPRSAQNPLEGLRDQLAGNPLMQSAFGDMLGRLDAMQQQMLDLFGQGSKDASGIPAAPPTYRGFNPPPADIAQQLDEFERAIGPLPLSVRAWCEIVGTVDFVGDHPGLASYTREGGGQIDLGGLMRGIAVQNPDMFNAVKDSHEADVQAYLEETAQNTPFPASAMMGMYRLMRQEMDAGEPDAPANPPPEEEIWWASDPLAFDFNLDAEEAQWEMENGEYDGVEPASMDS
jgi:hypothetical protein